VHAGGGALAVASDLVANVERVLLGKADEIRLVVSALLARGHVLIEDEPGMGKTLLAKALARSLGGTAGRVQGTVDLLPADITGVTVFDQQQHTWEFRAGPLFHNVVLFDEINRATPRAQGALLEAMAEGQVSVDNALHPLPSPFFVIATQNPTGGAGTFPLVSGEYDRFAISISLGLPDREIERSLLRGVGGRSALDLVEPVVEPLELLGACDEVDVLYASPAVEDYVLDLAAATRAHTSFGSGMSPRASQVLLQVARGHAVVHGRSFVTPDDVQAVAPAVLAHRVGNGANDLGPNLARAAVLELLATVPVPSV
jgi:MoxR-like ATPase